ncbi:protein HAIKU1-like [Vicia villosa]|uniref:protein HAIKU1-like n=1 Tax=Vicia villosa TaxID=3911 RepID=UPI00273C0877|nr:protein HAIKU1-like [Vicia villosa]
MENSRNRLNENMGVSKMGKTIKKNSAPQTIEFGHNGRHPYPPSKIHHIHRDDFKRFVIHATGREYNRPTRTQSEISRLQRNRPPPLANVRSFARFPMQPPPPRAPYINGLAVPPLQPISGPPLFDSSWNTFVESPISAFMRKFRDSENYYGGGGGGGGGDASRGNQFQQFPPPQPMINNVNVNVQIQPQYFPIQTQMVNNVEQYNNLSSAATNQTFPNCNPSVSMNIASNQTLPMNPNNQFLNDFPQSQTNYSMPPTSEYLLASPTQKVNVLSPQSPYRPLLSPSIFSSPSSPDYPFQPYLHNEILSPEPPSPLSEGVFPFTNSQRPDDE